MHSDRNGWNSTKRAKEPFFMKKFFLLFCVFFLIFYWVSVFLIESKKEGCFTCVFSGNLDKQIRTVLKVQSCKLYNNKYMFALTQITNT